MAEILEDFDTDVSNFFRSNLIALRGAISAQEFKNFGALNTGAQRVAFILSYPEAHDLTVEVENPEHKDSIKAMKLKEEGNKFFGSGNFVKAMEKYSNAVLVAPKEGDVNFVLIIIILEFFVIYLKDKKSLAKSSFKVVSYSRIFLLYNRLE